MRRWQIGASPLVGWIPRLRWLLLPGFFGVLLLGFGTGLAVQAENLLLPGNISFTPAMPTTEQHPLDTSTSESSTTPHLQGREAQQSGRSLNHSSTVSTRSRFEQAVTTPVQSPVQWDLGSDLPLPTVADERLGPNHKDVGFHIGLDFFPSKLWEVSGVAGVKINNGPVNVPVAPKPSMDQIGVEATMHF